MLHRNPKSYRIVNCSAPYCPYGPEMLHFDNEGEARDHYQEELLLKARAGEKLTRREKGLLASYANCEETVKYILSQGSLSTWKLLLENPTKHRLSPTLVKQVATGHKYIHEAAAREHLLRSLTAEELEACFPTSLIDELIGEYPYFASFAFRRRPGIRQHLLHLLENASDGDWAGGQLHLMANRITDGESWDETVALVARYNKLAVRCDGSYLHAYLVHDLERKWDKKDGELLAAARRLG